MAIHYQKVLFLLTLLCIGIAKQLHDFGCGSLESMEPESGEEVEDDSDKIYIKPVSSWNCYIPETNFTFQIMPSENETVITKFAVQARKDLDRRVGMFQIKDKDPYRMQCDEPAAVTYKDAANFTEMKFRWKASKEFFKPVTIRCTALIDDEWHSTAEIFLSCGAANTSFTAGPDGRTTVKQIKTISTKIIPRPATTRPVRNACKSKPCKNNGSCINTSDGYKCECARGYKGNNCGKETDYGKCNKTFGNQMIFPQGTAARHTNSSAVNNYNNFKLKCFYDFLNPV